MSKIQNDGVTIFVKNFGDSLVLFNRNKTNKAVAFQMLNIDGTHPWELPFGTALLLVKEGYFQAIDTYSLRFVIKRYEILKIYSTDFCTRADENIETFNKRMEKLNKKIEQHNEEMERILSVENELENGEDEEWYE